MRVNSSKIIAGVGPGCVDPGLGLFRCRVGVATLCSVRQRARLRAASGCARRSGSCRYEETPVPAFEVRQSVRPKTGPHAGVLHTIIFALADGGFNIRPELPARQIKYRQGAAYARPEELEAA